MDDAASEATQPGKFIISTSPNKAHQTMGLSLTTDTATQLMMDPRRLGENASDLEDEDMADIFVILHPASHAACIIASNINDMNPELTVSRNSVPARVRTSGTDPNVNATGTMELAEQGYQSCDLALRLSATLTDPTAGYVFGRSREWADFVIKYPSVDGMKRISNRHFRIWIEKSGVIMLEDTSTNGTWVDGKLLKADQKENKGIYKHTLVTGTQIKVQGIPNDDIKFIVTVPTRHGSIHEDLFYINMNDYFRRLEVARADRLRREAAEAAAAAARAAAEAAQQNGDGNHAAENNTNSGEAVSYLFHSSP